MVFQNNTFELYRPFTVQIEIHMGLLMKIGADLLFRNDLSYKLYSEIEMHACFVAHKTNNCFMNTYNDTVKQKCMHVYFGLH